MKKLSLALASAVALFAVSGAAHAEGIKIGQLQSNTGPIIGGQLIKTVKVKNAGKAVEVGNTVLANALDIEVDGQKVAKIGTVQGNSGIVAGVQAIKSVKVGGATDVSVTNQVVANNGAIKIKK